MKLPRWTGSSRSSADACCGGAPAGVLTRASESAPGRTLTLIPVCWVNLSTIVASSSPSSPHTWPIWSKWPSLKREATARHRRFSPWAASASGEVWIDMDGSMATVTLNATGLAA